jgi:hypothetical protein
MKKNRPTRWILLFLFLAVLAWVAVSENSCAQGVRALLGRKPDQPVLDSTFQVVRGGFRYYTFSLPEGEKNMALVGQFSVSTPGAQAQPGIEVYVLTEAEFDSWRKGTASAAVFQSGRVSEQKVQQNLPPEPGLYYLVFSNKFDPTSAKKVRASLALHSTSWIAY